MRLLLSQLLPNGEGRGACYCFAAHGVIEPREI
jgi:hypothetical protein